MSTTLPTPPRTIHRDKENLPLTPVTPSKTAERTPRIAWSQENLHHAYTIQIRQIPPSSSSKVPKKSILKKVSHSDMLPFMSPERLTREPTPEPIDPLQHPLYLNSPISTIVTSLTPKGAEISLIDLTEAYSVLSTRLKAKTQDILATVGPIAALEPLRDQSGELAKALRRDIGRAFVDPQGPSPPPSTRHSPLSTPSSVGSAKKRGFTEQEVKYARDLCNLCHAALRCFSNISVVPVLYSIFTDEQLSEILTDILAIPLAESLPTPNARKTWQLSIWILQMQRLPTAVLTPAASRIAYAIRRGMDGELGREGKQGAASDGLKAIGALLSRQPNLFMAPFAEILPSVYANVTSQNATLRVEAVHALLALSHAIVHADERSPAVVSALAEATVTYMTNQYETRKLNDTSMITKFVRTCFDADVPSHAAQSPMWALSVVATLIVLSGGEALTQNRIIKFVMDHLQIAVSYKKSTIRAVSGLVWRALVWACVQLDKSDEPEDKKESAWKLIRQLVDGGIGISIVGALLGVEQIRARRLSLVFQTITVMIKKGSKTCEEGVGVLAHVLSGVGKHLGKPKRAQWQEQSLLAEPLFDGTFLRAEWKQLGVHVKNGHNKNVALQEIIPLHEDEVVQFWDVIFAIWTEAIKRAPLESTGEVPEPLLKSWRSLLLTQAQLHQGRQANASESPSLAQIRTLLRNYLTDRSLDWSLEADSPSYAGQVVKLGFVYNLWVTTREVFAASDLSRPAATLFEQVMGIQFSFNQPEVRNAWVCLCSELLLAVAPHAIVETWRKAIDSVSVDLQRSLWEFLCNASVKQSHSHLSAIQFLIIPFLPMTSWELRDNELETWDKLVKCAIVVAEGRRVTASSTLDAIVTNINGLGGHKETVSKILLKLLSSIHNEAPQNRSLQDLPIKLLQSTSDFLLATYASVENGYDIPVTSFMILSHLTKIVMLLNKDTAVEALLVLQDGVRPWIEDEKEVVSDKVYNAEIIPLYVACLEALRLLPPSSSILNDFTPLLSAAFTHIPTPALGPEAFKAFWNAAYKSFDFSVHQCPEDLKPILRSVQELFCKPNEVFAVGLSQVLESQESETADAVMTAIPESSQEQSVADVSPSGSGPLGAPLSPIHQSGSDSADAPDNVDEEMVVVSEVTSVPLEEPVPPVVVHADINNAESLSSNGEATVRLEGSAEMPLMKEAELPGQSQVEDSQAMVEDAPEPPAGNRTHIKSESIDFDMVIAKGRSIPTSSQSSKQSSSAKKRRRSRLSNYPHKKRKVDTPPVGTEVINVYDSDDDAPIEESIVVTKSPRKRTSSRTPVSSYAEYAPSTPKSAPKLITPQKSLRTRKIYVEIPKLDMSKLSPLKRKRLVEDGNNDVVLSQSTKRPRGAPISVKEEPLRGNDVFDSVPSEDSSVHNTPTRPSEASMPSSRPGIISGRSIISPLPRRFRSEAYGPPSDDIAQGSSSPLKDAAARRQRHRAKTAPAPDTPAKLSPVKKSHKELRWVPSQEYLALEQAHVAIANGASKMELHELLKASHMANGITSALSNQMVSRLFSSSQEQPSAA